MKVAGSTAIVTGGNRGIGESFVRCLLDAGAERVYVGTRRLEGAAHLAGDYPDRAIPVELDVTRDEQVAAAAASCGDTSIVINNAGAFHDLTLIGAPDMTAARDEMEVNYFGVLSMCRHFAPVLASNGGGSIINVLSAAAIVPIPNMGGYSPAKFAARALTTSVRAELADQGTHVGCLIVGSIDTRMAAHVEGRKEPPETVARAGIKAIEHDISEMDTDAFAVNVRAALARDPGRMEKQMAALLKAETLNTGR
ncbi:SDR family oxidoreductase [Elongatibacter sediminis]|uniref:SDR family oxidoreductase n=1 Tax=Elongatibacter sediminis TaxID=3119006 RepID=A0AAW9R8W4_9GAMM